MNRRIKALWTILAVLGIAAARAGCGDAAVVRYNVSPGSTYTYFPSPFGPGIPGGMPSNLELDFGVGGSFSLDFMPSATPTTVEFVDVDLVLTGNEEIQANPPGFQPVTADLVADWLEMRLLVIVPSVRLFTAYEDQQLPGFDLQDWGSHVVLTGGYDARPADGDAMFFDLTATPVPEPSSLAAGIAAIGVLGFVPRRRRSRLRC